MSERTDAIKLANKILDTPNKDPDDNASILARQFLLSLETIEQMHKRLQTEVDWQGNAERDLIHANRNQMLKMHEEAIRRIKKHLQSTEQDGERPTKRESITKALRVIEALNTFHPMHSESWKSWGDE